SEQWLPVYRRSGSKLEKDDDTKKSHPPIGRDKAANVTRRSKNFCGVEPTFWNPAGLYQLERTDVSSQPLAHGIVGAFDVSGRWATCRSAWRTPPTRHATGSEPTERQQRRAQTHAGHRMSLW